MTEEIQQDYSLNRENLVPFYLIEDRIRQNFIKLQKFIARQQSTNEKIQTNMNRVKEDEDKYKSEVNKKFFDLEKRIVSQISNDLEGRIIVAINKNMASFTGRMVQKEQQIQKVSSGINDKLDNMKKQIINELSKENQKYFTKEADKLQKKIKGSLQETIKKGGGKMAALRPSSREKDHKDGKVMHKALHHQEQVHPQSYFSQQWVIKIKQMESKIGRFQQFMISFDKRFYQNTISLKESWKELGEEMLDTKRKLTTKQDELRLEIIKIKGIKQFQGSPTNYQQTFKEKLMHKFTDIYQLVANLVTKTDMQSSVQKLKKTLNRHDGQLNDVRQQMAKNTDYFTFYVNNSNQDDLSARIKQIKEDIQQKQIETRQRFKRQIDKNQILQTQISNLGQNVTNNQHKTIKLEGQIVRFKQDYEKTIDRIDLLEDHNKFSPQKMQKIHNTLDIDFTPSEQELITKKAATNNQNGAVKQLKMEIGKMKDEMFVLTHQLGEVDRLKKLISGFESKIQKFKIQSQQAILSRKPWVCLSCDKNDKQKTDVQKLKKQGSKKKLFQNKANLFSKQKSDKLIKLLPSTDEKFQVYERYRQKYLSDSVKLPDIYKQKIGDNMAL